LGAYHIIEKIKITRLFIKEENYMKEPKEKLFEPQSQLEQANKRLLNLEIIISLISIFTFLTLLLVVAYFKLDTTIKIILITTAIVVFTTGLITAMKIEREVGYYDCRKCHYKYIPNKLPFLLSMHIGRTRYLKCPKCHKYSWNKKVLTK